MPRHTVFCMSGGGVTLYECPWRSEKLKEGPDLKQLPFDPAAHGPTVACDDIDYDATKQEPERET